MSDTDETPPPASPEPQASPEVTALLLTTFADLYRQEVGAEEDVHRTLPFFGTALGIVIASLAYAAGRLPKWPDLPPGAGLYAFYAAAVLLTLAVLEAGCVLVWISFAIARRNHERIGPEADLRARVAELQAYYDTQSLTGAARDKELLEDVRQMLLDSYAATTPANRNRNQQRYKYRAWASLHLVRSLIWALSATSVIFIADKLAYLPKVTP
jgi:hypothetical protein